MHNQQDSSEQQLQSRKGSSVHAKVQPRYTCHGMYSVRHDTNQCDTSGLENPVSAKQSQESVVVLEVYQKNSKQQQLQ